MTFDEWLKDSVFTQQIRSQDEWMRIAFDAGQRIERERLRAALLDEAAEWTGDFRVPVHRSLCDVAKRADVPLTFDECYQAAKRAVQ